MKIFGFVKNVVFIGLTNLSDFTNASSLSCISMNNQAYKTRPEIINVTVIILYFIFLVLKNVNVLANVIIFMIHTQRYVFLIL